MKPVGVSWTLHCGGLDDCFFCLVGGRKGRMRRWGLTPSSE